MASVLLFVLCIIATCTSIYCHIAGVEREPKCSPFDYDKKTLENMVRVEHAMELMNAKVDNSLKALREELEEFDSMKLRLNEQLENNQKTVELMKEDQEKYKQNNQKPFKEEFDSMKLQLNEQLENNQKSFREEFDSVKLQLNEQLENNQKTVELMMEDIDELENRPSYAFSALWVDNTNPSVNDVLKFTRILLNDDDVYDANTGGFKAPVDGTYTFTANVCVIVGKYLDMQFLADDAIIGSFRAGDKYWTSCTSYSAMSQLLKGQIVKLIVVYRSGSGDIVFNRDNGFLSSFSGMLIQ